MIHIRNLAHAKGFYDLANHRSALWMFQALTAGRSPDEIHASALLNCLEMMRSGTTACVDHFPEQGFSLHDVDAVVRAYQDCGMRAIVALRVFDEPYLDIYPRAGEFPPEMAAALVERDTLKPRPTAELLDLCEAAIQRYHDPSGLIQIAPAPSNPVRCSDALLTGCQRLAERYDTRVHCHLLETKVQAEITHRRRGRGMVRHLDSLGALSDRLSCAHAIWVEEEDLPLMAERGTIVVHNPESNLRGGSGIAPVARMLRAGISVAIGADGSPSGGNQILQHSMRLATIVGRPQASDLEDWVTTRDAMAMATAGGAKVLDRTDEIGAIAVGRKADLVLYDLAAPWWSPLNDPIHQFVYSEPGTSARDMFINGRRVMAEGRITSFDADAVLADAHAVFARTLERNRDLMILAKRLGEAAL